MCFITTSALNAVFSWFLGQLLVPIARYGVFGIAKWLTFWKIAAKSFRYSLPILIPATITNLLELLVIGAIIFLAARARDRRMSFPFVICAVGPPACAIFFLESLAIQALAALAPAFGWNPPDFVFAVIVWGHVVAICVCVALVSSVLLRAPWWGCSFAGVSAAVVVWQVPAMIPRIWSF
jgi:hypothetical protein